ADTPMAVPGSIAVLLAAAVLLGACNVAQDQQDAKAVAARVHAQIQTSDYVGIYRASAPRFKTVGSAGKFETVMQQLRNDVGMLKIITELAYETGVDTNAGRVHTLTYELGFERQRMCERLIMVRADNGQMQLWKLDILPAQ